MMEIDGKEGLEGVMSDLKSVVRLTKLSERVLSFTDSLSMFVCSFFEKWDLPSSSEKRNVLPFPTSLSTVSCP